MRVILPVYHILYTLHAKYEFVHVQKSSIMPKMGQKNEEKNPFFSTVCFWVYFMFSKKLATCHFKVKFT